jgi:NADP-dependent 3-hydroxy acid dehydrogenase YdfG
LLAEGMRVVSCSRRQAAVADILAEADPSGERSSAVAVDVRDEASVQAAFAAARERFGGVDVLINNAGLGHAAPLAEGKVEEWREMLEVNLLGLCICTREALADMRARGGFGQIVHIGSMAGQRVPAGAGLYAATKHAVRALTESLRIELREAGDSIRVGEICPGFVETGFAAHYMKSEEKAREIYSQFKVLEADDVAEAVVYMLSCPPHVQVHDILMRPTEQPS